MKIASVTFFGLNEVGGGRIPAFAFAEYARLFGHDCQVINMQDKPETDLNNFDAIFFNTPPRSGHNFDYTKIEKPYALMIHDETDLNKYPLFEQMVNYFKCVCLVHIDHDGDFYKKYHDTRIAWHPCCMPEYLNAFYHPSANEIENPSSILYAGRIVEWKNPRLFLDFCENNGVNYFIAGKKYGNVDILPTIKPVPYDDMSQFRGKHDIFWDVCGTLDNRMVVKRINLTAFEAISNGMMPIVNINAVPKELKGAFIEIDPLNFSDSELIDKINKYRSNRRINYTKMVDRIFNSYANYKKVEDSVKNIINRLFVKCNTITMIETKGEPPISKILKDSAELFKQKNLEYGNAYQDHPEIMFKLLGPIALETVEDFSRYTRISSIVAKLNRYAKNWPEGHEDSATDLIVFAAMLKEFHNKGK